MPINFHWNLSTILEYAQFSVTLLGLFVLLFLCLGILDYLIFLLVTERCKFKTKSSNKYANQKSQNETCDYRMDVEKPYNSRNDNVNNYNNKHNKTKNEYCFPTIRHIIIPLLFRIIKLGK